MKTRLTLRPGQKGTKKLLAEHGERLVCVRYRYDAARGLRIKTAELIVEERPWVYCRPLQPPRRNPTVLVAIQREDRQLRREVASCGGMWRPEDGAWEMKLREARRLGIDGLVVKTVRRAGRRRFCASSKAREHTLAYACGSDGASTAIASAQ